MIKVFYTPLGYSDTTTFLLQHAAEKSRPPDYSKLLYLAPASVKADEAQKIFHRMQGSKCYIPPEMTTVRRYCTKLYSSYGNRRVVRTPLIPLILSGLTGKGLGFSSMAAGFISDLKQLYPGMDTDSIKRAFSDIFRESTIPESVAGGVMGVLDIFDRYQSFVRENGLIDGDDIINDVANTLKDSNKLQVTSNELKEKNPLLVTRHSLLILDGIYDITATERNVLKALIQSSESAYISIPYDPRFSGLTSDYLCFLKEHFRMEEIYLKDSNAKDSNKLQVTSNELKEKNPLLVARYSSLVTDKVTRHSSLSSDSSPSFVYYSYPDIEGEVEGIARNIKSLFVSGKLKRLEEVTVVFPDLNSYAAIVERIFSRYGIPYEISVKKSLGKMRPLLDVLCLLGSVSGDYPRLKFSQFLSSRHFSKMPESLRKWIPSLSLCSGIVSGKPAWLGFMTEGSEMFDMNLLQEKSAIEKDLRWVFKKLQPLDDIKSGAPFRVFVEAFRKILDDLGFPGPLPESLEDQPSASPAKKIVEAVEDIFEQISFLGTVNPAPVTISEFEEALHYLLHAAYLETGGSGVKIMGFPDVQGLAPHYLYFGGLSDGNIPKRQAMDYILPDNIKMKIGLLHLEKYNEMQKFVFEGITTACKHLHLSYPLMDGDAVFLPSSFLYSGEERREEIPGIFSKEEYFVRNGRESLLDYIPEIRVHSSLLKAPLYLRVTDIDAYRECPRRFFIEKELGLAPMSVKEYEVEAATIGTIIHKVMERLVKEPLGDREGLEEKAEAILDEIMRDKKMDAYWKRLIKDTFIAMLPGIYEKELEIREPGYVSSEVEKSISGEPLKGIKLKGKIDRIDRIGDEVQIIDYKTGTAGLNCTRIASGSENLQLLLYAAILKNHGYKVKRAGIYSLKDMHVKWCPPKRKPRAKDKEDSGQTIDDYITVSLKFLEEAVTCLRKGDFGAKPLNDYACWNCHEYAFCPYIQQ